MHIYLSLSYIFLSYFFFLLFCSLFLRVVCRAHNTFNCSLSSLSVSSIYTHHIRHTEHWMVLGMANRQTNEWMRENCHLFCLIGWIAVHIILFGTIIAGPSATATHLRIAYIVASMCRMRLMALMWANPCVCVCVCLSVYNFLEFSISCNINICFEQFSIWISNCLCCELRYTHSLALACHSRWGTQQPFSAGGRWTTEAKIHTLFSAPSDGKRYPRMDYLFEMATQNAHRTHTRTSLCRFRDPIHAIVCTGHTAC